MRLPSIRLEQSDDVLVLHLWPGLVQYRVENLDQLQRIWRDVTREFAANLYFPLGLAIALLASATGDPLQPMLDRLRLSKYLDSFYLAAPTPEASRELNRGMQEGMVRVGQLQGTMDLWPAWNNLIEEVNRQASGAEQA